MVTARAKGGNKGGDLPDVSIDGSEAAVEQEAVHETAEVVAAPKSRDPLAEIDRLRRETSGIGTIANGAAVAAAVAIIMAFTVPIWGSDIVANDAQSQRSAALAVAHLHMSSSSSMPFAKDLSLARAAISPKYEDFTKVMTDLEPLAKTGAPTKAELVKAYSGMADQVLVGKVVSKSDGWASWAAHKAASVVRIESVVNALAPKSVSPVETKLVRDAEEALGNGDLATAVEILSKLEGNAAAEVAPWLSRAKARLAIDNSIAKLQKILAARTSEGAYISFN
jgi:hypothetical protein